MANFGKSSIILLALSATSVGASESQQTFCQRLASQLGLRLAWDAARQNEQIWSIDTASLGMHLFGGSTATIISLTPIEGADAGFVSEEEACAYIRARA